ncbi:hypothetical protein GGS20DRAFT_453758 [Poronia punctata]|nr:hypothetical protein GGS20DRAFT_453758 [Poronia punctata]
MDRKGTIIANDESTVFQILLWFLLVAAMLSVGARLGTKFAMTRKLAWDDWLMLAAQSVYLAQCIAISMGASFGLGKPGNSLSETAIENFLKAEYISFVFQLLALALVKWSISAFIQQLSPSNVHHRRLVWVLRIVVGFWLVSGVVTELFQCALPTPWDYVGGNECIDRKSWWIYISAANIATETCIIALYFLIISKLHMSLARRTAVLVIFSTRIFVIILSVAQLIVFLDAFPFVDITVDLWLPTILNQAVLSASVVTACGPYLKPFMESLESGVARVDDRDSEEAALASSSTRDMAVVGSDGGYYLGHCNNGR